jgi:type I restriction enzyme S subunit
MAKEGKSMVVPRLRFPEFREAEGWESIPLGSMGKFLRGLTYGAEDVKNGGLLVLRSTNIQDGNLLLDNDLVFVEKNCPPELLLQPGDIAICMSNGSKTLVGKNAEYKSRYSGAVTVGAFCSIFRPSISFAKLAFKTERYADFVALAIGGGNINNLKNSDLELFEFAFPEFVAEQQKIADCLTSLDEVISAQGQKVEALKTYKRGLMQQLFPREGETLPRLRFPEFRDAPEWEEKTLRDICERIMDGTHFSPKTKDGPQPYLTSKNIRDGRIDLSTMSFISEDEHREIYKRCPVKKLDILLTKDGANTGNCAINTLDYEFSLLSSVAVLRGNPAQVTQEFLYQLIASERMQTIIQSSMSGQAITRITLEKLSLFSIAVPRILEQQKIATCLSFFDTKIADESEKLDALKTHKGGLMQHLFPTSP